MLQTIFKALVLGATFVILGLSAQAHAAKLVSGDNTKIYIDIKSGKRISAVEADKTTTLATGDEPAVMVCQPVEKECNERTGKCTIKVRK